MKFKLVHVLVVSLLYARQASAGQFIRGDSNLDGQVDISDPVTLLGILSLGNEDPGCADAHDGNDSGEADISDAIYALDFLFRGRAAPPAPWPDCAAPGGEPDCERRCESL